MAYVVFQTEEEAITAEAQAVANVQTFVRRNAPWRLSPDGDLICINAATGQPDPTAQQVERWAIPQQYQEGWGFPMPQASEIAPMPVDAFMAGVGGVVIDEVTLLPVAESVEP